MGALEEGRREATSDAWGELRDREREAAEQYLREKFPERYRGIIEDYYRALAEQDSR